MNEIFSFMRMTLVLSILFCAATASAQMPLSFGAWSPTGPPVYDHVWESRPMFKKWQLSAYKGASLTSAYTGNQMFSILAAPVGIQVNRRLNDHLYAFAGVSAAPALIGAMPSANSSLLYKNYAGANLFDANSLRLYSSVNMGLMYVNPERTFSISGSIQMSKGYSPIYYSNPIRPAAHPALNAF